MAPHICARALFWAWRWLQLGRRTRCCQLRCDIVARAAGLGILGISMGSIMPAMTAGVLTSSPPENSGLASGLLDSTRQVGGTIGVALLGTIRQTLPSSWGAIRALIIASLVLLCAADLSRRTLR